MKILKFDDDEMDKKRSVTDYIKARNNWGTIPWRMKKDPMNHWTAPFVTGHKYRWKLGEGLDFESL